MTVEQQKELIRKLKEVPNFNVEALLDYEYANSKTDDEKAIIEILRKEI